MDKEKFHQLATRLGRKTGAELEKIISFKQAEAERFLGEDESALSFACSENPIAEKDFNSCENHSDLYGKTVDSSEKGELQNQLKSEFDKQNSYFTLPDGYVNKYLNRVKPRPEITLEKGLIVCLHMLKRVDIE